MEKEKVMSMTKTGIIGLVVLIVILIGGYSILTRHNNNQTLGQVSGTSTDNVLSGTSSDMTATSTTPAKSGTSTQKGTSSMTGTTAPSKVATTEGVSNEFGGGIQSTSSVDESGNEVASLQISQAPRVPYTDQNDDVSLAYPDTWNVNQENMNQEDNNNVDSEVVMGRDFAGGMKAEMTVTVYNNATIDTNGNDADGNQGDDNYFELSNTNGSIVPGQKYETKLECKGNDLDCAGKTVLIPVSGHQTANGWEGKVVKISYGVFQSPDYVGPDASVSAQELYNVAQSVFQGVMQSVHIQGVQSATAA